ncbi:hypothetical protein Q3G72_029249 [Acer saccharum]|nr:hypothetical protein Q3G72_029249 [Acer saccharum]
MSMWSEALIPQSRLSWTSVAGVPLSCWDQTFFKNLGWKIGEPLLVEEETAQRSRFDSGKLLVLIPQDRQMPVKIKVDMEEFSFNVKLKEDPTPVISSWLKVFLGLEDNIPSYGLNSLPEMEMVDFLPWKKWWSEGAERYKKIEKRKEDNCGLVGEGSLLQENIKRVEKGCRVQNLSDIGREDSWVRKSRVNETEKGRCSARGNYGDGDTFSPFSDSKDKRGLQFQKVGNLTKDGSGGLRKEDGFDEPSHGSVVEADLSQLTSLKGLIENQELQMLEGPIGGVKVRLMGSLGTDHFEVSLDQGLDYEDGEIKSPKDMSCGGNVELCGNGSDGMELSILAPVSVEVLKKWR